MSARRPLGPGFDRERQAVADVAPHRSGRTAAELAALATDPPAVERPVAPTGRRPLAVPPGRTLWDQAPSAG
ncbi:hypothetical protein ACFY4B_41900 [Kitasatospora sp. NPDC001261]|uniref:hypothetical protein n=1 Tax=Kitasatospora sp. NPDC001261 TaxID=3364012 RepID=UPI0036C85358